MEKSKEPIRIRKRKLRNGNVSLYLDIYINGKRRYEFLKLYLVPEKTRADKEKNKETTRLADAVRAQRVVELQNGRFGFDDSGKADTNFIEYFRMLCEKRHQNPDSSGNYWNWNSALKHIERYCRPNTTFRDVTPAFVKGFKNYLDKNATSATLINEHKPLSHSTKWSYFNKLRTCLNKAFEDGIISRNPMRGIEGFKLEEQERVYLTLDEVKAMAATECKYPALRKAFLFSCLTGLRKSDIKKMRWKEVRQQGDFTRIVFRQKKTGGQEYIDISPQAVEFMGERGDPEDYVFPDFNCASFYLKELKPWAERAGVMKDITFHSGRHTFAVMMLDLGVDIYTVSKLLGHKEIQTTQIYAKVMDKKKQEAAMLIPRITPDGAGAGKQGEE